MDHHFNGISYFRHALIKSTVFKGPMKIIGVHLDPPFLQVCLLSNKRGKQEILMLKATPAYALDDVKQLYKKNFRGKIVSSLSANHFLIKSIELPPIKGKYREKAIAFQADTLSYLSPEEVITVPLQITQSEALLVTVSKEAIQNHLSQLKNIEIDPDAIHTTTSALYHFIRWKASDLNDLFLVDIGAQATTCLWIEKGGIKKTTCIPIGTEALIAALFSDRKKVLLRKEIEGAAKQIDLLLLKPGLNPHLTTVLNELRQEIGRTYFSFLGEEERPFIVTGKLDVFIHLKQFLVKNPEARLSKEEELFAIAIGTALEQTHPDSTQLRQAEFFPEKNWRRLGVYASFLFALSFTLSVFLIGLGVWFSGIKKKSMAEHVPSEIQGDIEERIDKWVASIEAHQKEYPYIMQAPKASEFLAWLSSYPVLQKIKSEGDPIHFKDIHYELIKFPKIASLKEPYLAKVEIKFKFKNSLNARRFHEALRNETSYIDLSKELSWETSSDSYKASFFLKNKGSHAL